MSVLGSSEFWTLPRAGTAAGSTKSEFFVDWDCLENSAFISSSTFSLGTLLLSRSSASTGEDPGRCFWKEASVTAERDLVDGCRIGVWRGSGTCNNGLGWVLEDWKRAPGPELSPDVLGKEPGLDS